MIKSENLGRINLNGETFQDLYVEIEPELDTLELMAIFSELKARGYNYEAINKLLKEAYGTDPAGRVKALGCIS